MRTQLILSAAVGALLSACGGSSPPPPAAPASPTAPVVVGYKADVRPMNARKQAIHAPGGGNMCVTVKDDNASQHALVHLVNCHAGEAQRWDFGPGAAGAVQVGGIGGLCLSVMSAPGGEGSMTEVLTCNGSLAQEFRFYVDGRIQELGGSRCLMPSGVGIVLAPCDTANPMQVWQTP